MNSKVKYCFDGLPVTRTKLIASNRSEVNRKFRQVIIHEQKFVQFTRSPKRCVLTIDAEVNSQQFVLMLIMGLLKLFLPKSRVFRAPLYMEGIALALSNG